MKLTANDKFTIRRPMHGSFSWGSNFGKRLRALSQEHEARNGLYRQSPKYVIYHGDGRIEFSETNKTGFPVIDSNAFCRIPVEDLTYTGKYVPRIGDIVGFKDDDFAHIRIDKINSFDVTGTVVDARDSDPVHKVGYSNYKRMINDCVLIESGSTDKYDGYIDRNELHYRVDGKTISTLNLNDAYKFNLMSKDDYEKKYPEIIRFNGWDVSTSEGILYVGCKRFYLDDIQKCKSLLTAMNYHNVSVSEAIKLIIKLEAK